MSRNVVCPHCRAINRLPDSKPAGLAKCGACREPIFAGKPHPVDAAGFDKHLARSDVPLVVDFWAPWCGPCLAMAPAFERAAVELEPEFRLLKVDTEAVPALSARYGIRSIPTLMLFKAGHLAAQSPGARDTRAIVEWVRAQNG